MCPKVEKILNYNFSNKTLLIEALTHRTFNETHNLPCGNFEKLEVLGDAILDYLANSNLLRYTMFERYNIEERRHQKYIMPEDFKPFDAHQAKCLLTKNDFLAKLVILFGIHEHVLFEKPKLAAFKTTTSTNEMEIDWVQKPENDNNLMESEVDKYIRYTSQKNFRINNQCIELFEPSKILGDVFEALMAAVFRDGGGMEAVLEVY